MNHIILVNPDASYLRKKPLLSRTIYLRYFQRAQVVVSRSESDLDQFLTALASANLGETAIYTVGGDGICNKILNWILSLPREHRPCLMPVGGGQFNFMAKFCGCKDANPLKNLGAVFAKHPFVNLVGCESESMQQKRRAKVAMAGSGVKRMLSRTEKHIKRKQSLRFFRLNSLLHVAFPLAVWRVCPQSSSKSRSEATHRLQKLPASEPLRPSALLSTRTWPG